MMNASETQTFQEFGDRKATYSINKFRLRGATPDANQSTILALGDSFTFGLLLNEKNTYLHLIQQKIDHEIQDSIQVLNGGIGGSGLADWPGWLNEFGNKINPDYVLYFLNTEDLERALSKNLYVLQGDSSIQSQRWKPREWMFEISRKGWYQKLQANSQFFNLVVKVLWAKVYFDDLTHNFDANKATVPVPDPDIFNIESEYSLRLGKLLLHKMHQWCITNNCELIVTTTGYFSRKEPPKHTQRLYEWLNTTDSDFYFFDNTSCVASLAQQNLSAITIPGDSHPNEKGAQFIADCTWQKLSEKL